MLVTDETKKKVENAVFVFGIVTSLIGGFLLYVGVGMLRTDVLFGVVLSIVGVFMLYHAIRIVFGGIVILVGRKK